MTILRWCGCSLAVWALATGIALGQSEAGSLQTHQFDDLLTGADPVALQAMVADDGQAYGDKADNEFNEAEVVSYDDDYAAYEDKTAAFEQEYRNHERELLYHDAMLQQAQATTQRRSTAARSAARSSRSSRVPYMIGDSPYGHSNGGNQGLTFGGLGISDINHPVFGGNRFNVAEAGAFIPNDRFLFSYRHMHNVHTVNALGSLDTVDQDRFLFGVEKTLLDGICSVEVRLPVIHQLGTDQEYFSDSGGTQLSGDRNGEIGNLALNFKLLLRNEQKYGISAGIGVSAPTARSAHIEQTYDTTVTVDASSSITAATDLAIDGHFENETVNLIPYVSWFYRPNDRFWHQGFYQTDCPVNGSSATVDVDGLISPSASYSPVAISTTNSGDIVQPSLIRANLSFGYWLAQGCRNGRPTGVAALFEVHYTHSLNDAQSLETPLGSLIDGGGSLPTIPLDINAGAGRSHIDVVNLGSGVMIDLGGLVVTNGVIVPVSDDDRFFDFEYNLQVNKRF